MSSQAPHTVALLNGTSRTLVHLAGQALAKGHHVRAVVRSAARYTAQNPKQDGLSVHEWSDFNDVAALAPILDGVDVVYIALGGNTNESVIRATHLNEDAVEAVCAVLHSATAAGARCPTKLVLLTSQSVHPAQAREPMGELMLGHQFDDLRRAQEFLRKQAGWLDAVCITPGMLIDSEVAKGAHVTAVRLTERIDQSPPTSYARLAAALQMAGADAERYAGKHLAPIATSKVRVAWKDLDSLRHVMRVNFTHRLLPYLARSLAFGGLAAALGYTYGVREQGVWVLQRFGVNLRSLW